MARWPPSTVDEVETWNFVVAELAYHAKKELRHSWIDTLNRLVRKTSSLGNAVGDLIKREDIPLLTEFMLDATPESWSLEALKLARNAMSHARANPVCDQCPILVLDLFGATYIVDGSTRVNRRIRDGEMGPHHVIRIKVDD